MIDPIWQTGEHSLTPETFEPEMTLRDWFAGQALPWCLEIAAEYPKVNKELSVETGAASDAYAIADAMIEARKQEQS